MIQLLLQPALQADVTTLGAVVTANQVGQVRRQDLPEPTNKLGLGVAAKLGKMAVRFKKRLLHEVGRIHLTAQAPADLHSRQQCQIIGV